MEVQHTVEKAVLEAAKVVESQLDAEIERLDQLDDSDLEALRKKRLQQMKQQAAQREEWRSKGHGQYTEIAEEKEFFEECKKSERVVCHFYRDSTFRCKIVDKHLALLAPKHLETRFLKLSVDRAPFLCERLKIRILPTIGIVVEGKTKDFIKGFDDLGGHDEFSTEMLEWRLGCSGVVDYAGNLMEPPDSSSGEQQKQQVVFQGKKSVRQSNLDSDSDD